ncbi:MarR family transcriptional regulator [Trinickia terrae]|uniref:MarR family transcriptional regulator n=1 Tax=Trinickia terrae TaxID=2571161 RepID=A0A4U1I3C8_9BURK|nr:MarR family transcriptional regulator [Trinickia terrae]TKC87695.1 MarR family transcriptional regulator [Trinickia terrae]
MSYLVNDDFERTKNLVFALSKARNLVAAELEAGLNDVGINVQQLGVLVALARGNASTPAELSKLLGVNPGRMTRVLDEMERSALVQRSRNGNDRRVVDVALTPEGRRTAALSGQIVSTVRIRRLSRFTTSEFDVLSALLCKLLDA